MREKIIRMLNGLGVNVLYACESGSRAWGFESVDSDWDVRFVYVRDVEWYLRVYEGRDVIEELGEIDLVGWDVRKALRLFHKHNPSLMEWLGSPIVYVESEFAERLRRLKEEYFSRTSSCYHYYHMAKGNYRSYLRGEEVWVKKYLYVLRPLLAVRWIVERERPVPVKFSRLVDVVEGEQLLVEIERLVAEKKAGKELRRGPRRPVIDSYITSQLSERAKYEAKYDWKKRVVPIEELDRILLDCLSDFSSIKDRPQAGAEKGEASA